MATVKKIKKAQSGAKEYTQSSLKKADSLRFAQPKVGAKGLKGMMEERKSNRAKADSIEKAVEKRIGVPREGNMYEKKNGGKMKAGGMLKRADGSTSQRGLWDNIRAAKGSGKKPTAQMLKQEKKIKAKTKK